MRHRVILSLVLAGGLMIAGQAAVAADDMPPPKSAPRIKVVQQKLSDASRGRVVTGAAKMVDAERVRIGDTEIRLFGIALPQPDSPHGTAAREALAKIIATGAVNCLVLERDRSFRLQGICETAKGEDVGLLMLQKGWAVTVRSAVLKSDYAGPYLAAETKAQALKSGIWAPAESPKPVAAKETKKDAESQNDKETAKTDKADKANAKAAETKSDTTAKVVKIGLTGASTTEEALTKEEHEGLNTTAENSSAQTPALNAAVISIQQPALVGGSLQPFTQEQMMAWLWFAGATPALIMILYGLGQIALRYYEYRQERRTLAAALRGELMAARAICTTRAEALSYDPDVIHGRGSLWPRIRTNVYAAHVGRIGLLGADLARKVSSLYGQFADYAQYYAPRAHAHGETHGRDAAANVQQTLFTLIDHIAETLGNLQQVEAKGRAYHAPLAVSRNAAPQQGRVQQQSPPQAVAANPASRLEYYDTEIVEEETTAPAAAARGDGVEAKPQEKSSEEKIAEAAAMMEMLIAEQEDEPIEDTDAMAMFEPKRETPSPKTQAAGGGKSPGKAKTAKSDKDKAQADQLAENKEAKKEAAAESEAKAAPKDEFYDFRSQATNIAR